MSPFDGKERPAGSSRPKRSLSRRHLGADDGGADDGIRTRDPHLGKVMPEGSLTRVDRSHGHLRGHSCHLRSCQFPTAHRISRPHRGLIAASSMQDHLAEDRPSSPIGRDPACRLTADSDASHGRDVRVASPRVTTVGATPRTVGEPMTNAERQQHDQRDEQIAVNTTELARLSSQNLRLATLVARSSETDRDTCAGTRRGLADLGARHRRRLRLRRHPCAGLDDRTSRLVRHRYKGVLDRGGTHAGGEGLRPTHGLPALDAGPGRRRQAPRPSHATRTCARSVPLSTTSSSSASPRSRRSRSMAAQARDVSVEFYIVSSGLYEVIAGSEIVRANFTGFYACHLDEDETGVLRHVKRCVTSPRRPVSSSRSTRASRLPNRRLNLDL